MFFPGLSRPARQAEGEQRKERLATHSCDVTQPARERFVSQRACRMPPTIKVRSLYYQVSGY
jgi:hypothetical protein